MRNRASVYRPSEELARAVLEASPDLIFRLDRNGVFLDYVPARALDTVVPAEEFLGRNLADILPSIAPDAMRCTAAALDSGCEQSFEYELPLDGDARFFEARLVPAGEESVIAIVRDVTDKHITAEKLQQSEERFRSVVETAGDAIILLSPDSTIVELNREAEKLCGCDRDDVRGKNHFELFVPEELRAAAESNARKVLTGEPTRGLVNPVKAVDGSTRLVSWNVDRLVDARGAAVGLIACGRDVTVEKRLEWSVFSIAQGVTGAKGEEFLRVLTKELSEILEADIVFLGELLPGGPDKVSTIARYVDGKEAENIIYPLAGSPCEGVIGRRICSYPEGVHARFPEDVALKSGGIEGYVGAPLFDSDDRPMGLIAVLYRRPILTVSLVESVLRIFATRLANELERTRAEDELLASDQLNRTIVDSMPGGIVRLDSDGRLVQANEYTGRFFGLSFDEMRRSYARGWDGHTVREDGTLCPLSEYPGVRCLATGEAQKPRVIGYRRADGDVAWGLFTAAPIMRTDRNGLDGAMVMFVDITERKRAEAESQKLQAQVQHTQKLESLGVLAGGIAHDFNNLLTGILGNSSLALSKLPSDSDLRVNLTRVEHAATRAAELTNQMLAYAGKGSFVIRTFSLNELVRDLVPLLEASVSKKVTLDLDLEEHLVLFEGDRSQIEQVVMNLITNAGDAIADNEGKIIIRTRTEDEGAGIGLEVTDTGCGMDAVTQARIFDPFYTTKFTGRGLGLAAVQGIVRGHKGRIRVKSVPGRGTTFVIHLPASPDASQPEIQGATSPDGAVAGTILVIDDEEAVRDVIEAALASVGIDVLLAKDGVEGIDVFREHHDRIDGVVLDVSMPRMDGEETVERILRLRPDVRLLLTSGYSEQDTRRRFRTSSVRGFIHKPFHAQDLIEKVQDLLRRAELTDRRPP